MAAMAAACVLAGPAAARDAGSPQKEAEIELRGTNGYSATLMFVDEQAMLRAERGPFYANYLVDGRTSPRWEARFGSLGRVSVEFQPTRTVESKLFKGCFTELGTFRGTIRFRGERGYTSVNLTEAAGRVLHLKGRGECMLDPTGLEASPSSSDQSRLLTAERKGRAGFVRFAAMREPTLFRQPFFAGEAVELRGSMIVGRGARATGRAGSFRVVSSGRTRVGRLKPPWPFRGRAVFRSSPGSSPTWRGNLRVPVPGTGRVRMSGRRFKARLCVKRTSPPGCLFGDLR